MTWIKLISTNAYQRIIDFGNSPAPNDNCIIWFHETSLNLYAGVFDSNTPHYRDFTQITLGTWTHVAFSVTGSTGSIYINGVLRNQFTGTYK